MFTGASFFRQLHAQEGSGGGGSGSNDVGSGGPSSSLSPMTLVPVEASWGALWAALLHASVAHRGLLMLVMLHVRKAMATGGWPLIGPIPGLAR